MKSGIDIAGIKAEVRPQDDLFRHVNGKWLDTAVIPDDRAVAGSFITLRDEAELAVRAIVEEAAAADAEPGTAQRKIGDLYGSFMAEASREPLGADPIRPALDEVAALSDVGAFVTMVGECNRSGTSGFCSRYVINDSGDPTRYLLHLYQGGLGLPDESYYRDEKFADIVTAYEAHIARLFTLAGLDDVAARAAAVLQLERDLAGRHWDVVTCRDPQLTYNRVTRDGLDELQPYWPQWIAGLGAPESAFAEVVVMQPSFFSALGELLTAERLEDWKNWLLLQIIHSAAPYLTAAFAAEYFDFNGKTLSGTPTDRELWKRGVGLVEDALGEAVGELYVQRHFPASSKQRMEELVGNLIEAYRRDIGQLTWMSDETKQRALEKLTKFTPKIGYPNSWRDYTKLEIEAGDLVGNVVRASAFEWEYQLGKLGGPIDPDEWHMTPQTVNAYYMPTANEIVFPAAILQPPFFDADADDAANYGGIGSVIGHEIGHGFDDKGSQYDGTGALRDWWTEEDRKAFDALTSRLIAQYDALQPRALAGHHVNGALTVGENIGDLGGLTISYAAYLISLADAEPEMLDGLTGPQRLFYSWGAIWQGKSRDEEAIRRLATDPHSPAEFRCNAVVRNLQEFYEAFDLVEGDQLWLAPQDRVRIW
ncbi:MAG: M13 family metallopeptidase [Jatrophihabitans sp.]